MPEFRETFKFEVVGALAAGTAVDRWVAGYNGEIEGIEAVLGTAPATAAVQIDITKNGTSLFTSNVLGTVASGSTAQGTTGNVNTTQTYVDVQLGAGKDIAVGSVILIDSEQMLVTAAGGSPAVGGTGLGNVARLTVTRAQNSTSAASHNAGANVTFAPPTIAVGATTLSQTFANEDLGTFAQGDVLALNLAGSFTAAANLDLNVAYVAT